MKPSEPLHPSEETGTEFPVSSNYGRTAPNKHRGVGRQQQHIITIQETKLTHSTSAHYKTADTDIQHWVQYITN